MRSEVTKLRLLLELKDNELQALRLQVKALQEQNQILQQASSQTVAPIRFSKSECATCNHQRNSGHAQQINNNTRPTRQ